MTAPPVIKVSFDFMKENILDFISVFLMCVVRQFIIFSNASTLKPFKNPIINLVVSEKSYIQNSTKKNLA